MPRFLKALGKTNWHHIIKSSLRINEIEKGNIGDCCAAGDVFVGGLKLTNLGIKDNAGGGSIVLDSIQVVETGKSSLAANAKIGVTPDGLYIKPAGQNISAYIGGVHLGSATAKSIGDVEIKGLNMGASTISITGH